VLGGKQPVLLDAIEATQPDAWRVLPHYIAPWWYAVLIFGFVPLALTNLRLYAARDPAIIESIADITANDQPIGWNDPDALGLKPLALAISRFLRNVNTSPPLTIAVTGRWGSGKSSLMKLVAQDLKTRATQVVWFNAWHHSQEEHLFAALMEAIRSQAVPPAWLWSGVLFRSRLLWSRTRSMWVAIAFALIFALIIVTIVYFGLGDQRGAYFDHLASHATATLAEPSGPKESVGETSYFGILLAPLFNWVRSIPVAGPVALVLVIGFLFSLRTKLIAFPANPSALLAALSRRARVKDFHDRLDFRYQFGEALGEVAEALRTPTSAGLVVCIDDLDRCQPQDVVKILEAVNFIVSSGPCIVVLGMDRHQIEHAVGLAFDALVPGLSNEELNLGAGEAPDEIGRRRAFARLYLEKLINLEISIPQMTADAALAILGVEDRSVD
jgi:hypothetical protein